MRTGCHSPSNETIMAPMKSIIIFLFFWGMNLTWARGPSIVEVPEYIDTEKGKPFLFFLSQGFILIRECDPAHIAPAENSCKILSGKSDIKVEWNLFADILKSLLLLEEGNYGSEMKEKIKFYNTVQGQKIQKIMAKIAKVRENKSIVTSPRDIISLVDDLLKGEPLCSAENKLPSTGVHTSSADVPNIQKAVDEIEKRLKHLLEGISSAGLLMYVSPKRENKNFSYNLLSSFLSFFHTTLSNKN